MSNEAWREWCRENPKLPVHVFWQEKCIELQAQVNRVISEAKPVYATGINTGAVNLGYELGGYVKHYIIPTHVLTALKGEHDE